MLVKAPVSIRLRCNVEPKMECKPVTQDFFLLEDLFSGYNPRHVGKNWDEQTAWLPDGSMLNRWAALLGWWSCRLPNASRSTQSTGQIMVFTTSTEKQVISSNQMHYWVIVGELLISKSAPCASIQVNTMLSLRLPLHKKILKRA